MKYRTIVADPPWEMPKVMRLPYPTMTTGEIAALPIAPLLERGVERHVYLWTTSHRLEDAFAALRAWGVPYSATLVWCKPRSVVGGRFPSNVEFCLFGMKPAKTDAPDLAVEIAGRIGAVVRSQGLTANDLDRIAGRKGTVKWMTGTVRCSEIPDPPNWAKLVAAIPELHALDEQVRAANDAKGQTRSDRRRIYPTADSRWFEWPNPSRHSAKPEAFYDLVETVSPGPYLELFARRNRLGWDTWGNESLEHVELA